MIFSLHPALYLLLAHLIGDFVMQTDFLASMKAKNNFILCIHAAIWTLVCAITLDFLHLYQWWHLPWLFGTHIIMDWIKCHKMPQQHSLGWCLWVDQTVHIFTLLVCLIPA